MRTYSIPTGAPAEESPLNFDPSPNTLSRRAERADQRPRFVLRKVNMARAYRVIALWPSGLRERLGTFTDRRDAMAWISTNSKSWRRERTPPATS